MITFVGKIFSFMGNLGLAATDLLANMLIYQFGNYHGPLRLRQSCKLSTRTARKMRHTFCNSELGPLRRLAIFPWCHQTHIK